MCSAPLSHAEWLQVFAALEAEASSAYVLAPDLSLVFVNRSWRTFARQNGAPALADDWSGYSPITLAIDAANPALREFFTTRLRAVLARNEPWSHTYECSAPGLYRRFNLRAWAGPGKEGVIVVHSLVTEAELTATHDDIRRAFTDHRGLIVRCAACGRTARPGETSVWEWVPGLDDAHNVSSGICAVCSVEHYGFFS
jgi:hypothetical protein